MAIQNPPVDAKPCPPAPHASRPPTFAMDPSIAQDPDPTNGALDFWEITKRRHEFGNNVIRSRRKKPATYLSIIFTAPFLSFNMILILLSITSCLLDDFYGYGVMGIILGMLLVSIVISVFEQRRKEVVYSHSAATMNTLGHGFGIVSVVRYDATQKKNTDQSCFAKDLVPGDLIRIFPGNVVPADVEIVTAKHLQVLLATYSRDSSTGAIKRSYGNVGATRNIYHHGTRTWEQKQPNLISKLFRCCRFKRIPNDKRDQGNPKSDEFEMEDLSNKKLYMGSGVISGTALCKVIATGANTEYGKLAKENDTIVEPNHERGFLSQVNILTGFIFVLSAALIPCQVAMAAVNFKSWTRATTFILPLCVALIPKFVPAMISLTLARRASKTIQNFSTTSKDLDTIIRLAGVDVICVGVTGLLTMNYPVLKRTTHIHGHISIAPLVLGYLSSKFQTVKVKFFDHAIDTYFKKTVCRSHYQSVSSPTTPISPSVSTTSYVNTAPDNFDIVENTELVYELPFDFERRRGSVILRDKTTDSDYILICKGALGDVMDKCTEVLRSTDPVHAPTQYLQSIYYAFFQDGELSTRKLTPDDKYQVKIIHEAMSQQCLRATAIAIRKFNRVWSGADEEGRIRTQFSVEDEENMTLVGLFAFQDFPKYDSITDLRALMDHGVKLKLVTGESPLLAQYLWRMMGMPTRKVTLGQDLSLYGIPPETVARISNESDVFAKVSPFQKEDIVKGLKKRGYKVGYIGNSSSDLIAMTEADVAFAISNEDVGGIPACANFANVVVPNKALNSIAESIFTARMTLLNLKKYVITSLSYRINIILTFLVAASWLPFESMTTCQLLIHNFLCDIAHLSLLWDDVDEEDLKRSQKAMMRELVTCIFITGFWSSVYNVSIFLAMYFCIGVKTSKNDVSLFQSAFFTGFLLWQALLPHLIRTWKISFFQSFGGVSVGLMTIFMAHIAVCLPLIPVVNDWLNLKMLPWEMYVFLGIELLVISCVVQIAKINIKYIHFKYSKK